MRVVRANKYLQPLVLIKLKKRCGLNLFTGQVFKGTVSKLENSVLGTGLLPTNLDFALL